MKFARLVVRDFGSVRHLEAELDAQGMVLVEGQNEDAAQTDVAFGSNGAGKSWSFAESLYWCLFGRTLRGVPVDGVIRAGAEKGARVTIEFEKSGHKVVVTRYRGHPEHGNHLRLRVDGEDRTGSTQRLTEQTLRVLLSPVDEEVFRYTILFGQGMPDRFSQLTDAGRKELLESILGVSIYEEARVLSRRMGAQAERDADATAARVDGIESELNERRRELKELEAQLDKMQSQQEEADAAQQRRREELEADVEVRRLTVQDLEQERRYLTDGILTASRLTNRLGQRLDAIRDSIAELEQLLAADTVPRMPSETCHTCGQSVVGERLEELQVRYEEDRKAYRKRQRKLRSKLSGLGEQHDTLQAWMASLRRRVRRMEREHDTASASAKEAASHIDRSEAELSRLRKADPPSEVALKLLQSALERQRAAVQKSETALTSASAEKTELRRKSGHYSTLTQGFAEMRVKIVSCALDYLNMRLAGYLREMTDGEIRARVEVDEQRLALVVDTSGGTYQSCSGGERDRVDVATALALNDLAFAVSGLSSNLLVCDEPGGFLDAAGTGRMVRLLRQKAEHVGTVLFMTQRVEARALVPRCWLIRKVGGISRLEQVR